MLLSAEKHPLINNTSHTLSNRCAIMFDFKILPRCTFFLDILTFENGAW